jgi:hypothetical protein
MTCVSSAELGVVSLVLDATAEPQRAKIGP